MAPRTLTRCLGSAAVVALVLTGCAVDQSAGGGDSGAADAEGGAAQSLSPAEDFTTIDLALVADAEAEGGSLAWYESSSEDQAAEILAAFQADYPFVTDVEHVRLRGAEVAPRVAQEVAAGVPTGDVLTTDAASLGELESRDLLAETEWTSFGVPEELVAGQTMISTAAAVYVIIYNTDLVSPDEAPASWEDLLDPEWTGKIGVWEQPFAFAELAPVWGQQQVTDFAADFAAQQPRPYESAFPLAQAVGAGEIPIGIGAVHASQPAIAAGAPIDVVVPDPTSFTMLYSAVADASPNPATARLFAAWLTSETGQLAYEGATDRGNPLLPGTQTAALVGDREISTFPPEEASALAELLAELAAIRPN